MEAALAIAACGRPASVAPCDGGLGGASRGGGASTSSIVRRDHDDSDSDRDDEPNDDDPPPPAPLILVTDRLDTCGGAAVFDRAWAAAAAALAGRAQATRVAVLALEPHRAPSSLYGALLGRRLFGGDGAASAAPLGPPLLRVVDGHTDPFGWVGAGGGAASGGVVSCCCSPDDLEGLARAAVGSSGDGDDGAGNQGALVVVIDSLSALLARHAPLDVLRWLDTRMLRSPRVSAVVALLHSDEGGGEEEEQPERDGNGGLLGGHNNTDPITSAFESLASACLQLRPLTPAQKDLSGADGELRVVTRRRGGGGGGAAAAAAGAAAVDSTRVFSGAGRPRAERLLYTLGVDEADEYDQEAGRLSRWLRATVELAPMPREVAAPDARTLAARAVERSLQQQQQQKQRAPVAPPAGGVGGGQRHDRQQQQQNPQQRRAWAPLSTTTNDGSGSAATVTATPGRILFERDSGGSSAESGADPDEDLEI